MHTRPLCDPTSGLSQEFGSVLRRGGAVSAQRRGARWTPTKPDVVGGLVVASATALMLILAACSGSVGPPKVETGTTTNVTVGTSVPGGCAGHGTVKHATFDTSSQGEKGDYQVYLPPCYEADRTVRYPVVYLLHGASHDDTYWLRVGIEGAADVAIASGHVAPMIIVMPDGGPVFATGRAGATFGSFLVDELVPRIDASYRTRVARAGRAIGGISMGGGQALAIAAEAPTMFVAAGGHSPAVPDPAVVAAGLSHGHVRVWLDVGEADLLRFGTIALADELRATGATVQLHTAKGRHDDSYWRAHLGEYLAFYDGSFKATK